MRRQAHMPRHSHLHNLEFSAGNTVGYTGKVISGDCRVDIPWLPADLFTSSTPAHLRDRMPHVEGAEIGEQWFAGGKQLGFGGVSGVGAKPKLFWDPYVPVLSTRPGWM